MRWPWPWPFCHRNKVAADHQQQQIAQSMDHVLATTTRMREEATADLTIAADGAKAAIVRRLSQSSPLRDVLAGVVERQREQDRSR